MHQIFTMKKTHLQCQKQREAELSILKYSILYFLVYIVVHKGPSVCSFALVEFVPLLQNNSWNFMWCISLIRAVLYSFYIYPLFNPESLKEIKNLIITK